jgi:hypothetical protein
MRKKILNIISSVSINIPFIGSITIKPSDKQNEWAINHLSAIWASNYRSIYCLDKNKDRNASKLKVNILFENTSDKVLKNLSTTSYVRPMWNEEGQSIDPYSLESCTKTVVFGTAKKAFLKPGENIDQNIITDINRTLGNPDVNSLTQILFPNPQSLHRSRMTKKDRPKEERQIRKYFIDSFTGTGLTFITDISDYHFSGVSGFYFKWLIKYDEGRYQYEHLYQGGIFYPVWASKKNPNLYNVTNKFVYDFALKSPPSKCKRMIDKKYDNYIFEEEVDIQKAENDNGLHLISLTPYNQKDFPFITSPLYANFKVE